MVNKFRLGLFLIVAVALFAGGSFLIGQRQFLFSSTYELKSAFKNVSGLADGAAVRVGGIHKGIVTRIELPATPGGDMVVRMNLEKSTAEVIRADSVASIHTEGLLGNKYVDISFGTEGAARVAKDTTIRGEPPVDFSDMMKKTNDILESTTKTMQHVENTTSDLMEVTGKINRGAGTMGALVNDRAVYSQLNQATAQAKLGAMAFQENMEAMKHNFLLKGFFSSRGYDDVSKLTKYAIAKLPDGPQQKTFVYDATKLFTDVDKAKLQRPQLLTDAGKYLESTPFGQVVVVGASGRKGDSEEMLQLMRARAMVVREYLVNNFRMDDTRLKTFGRSKTAQAPSDNGTIEILVYPERPAQSDKR